MSDWKWKIGFLHGHGECMWQELAGKIRRITKPAVVPGGGMILMKSLACIAAKDTSPQFDSDVMVIASQECRDDLAEDATRAWEGGTIIPANGNPRFKLT